MIVCFPDLWQKGLGWEALRAPVGYRLLVSAGLALVLSEEIARDRVEQADHALEAAGVESNNYSVGASRRHQVAHSWGPWIQAEQPQVYSPS